MGEGPSCPQCGSAIQPTWDWCHGCGWDPEGLKPAGWTPAAPPAAARPAPAYRPPETVPPAGRGGGGAARVLAVIFAIACAAAGWVVAQRVVGGSAPTASEPVEVPKTWQSFTSPAGGFTVDLPGQGSDVHVAAGDLPVGVQAYGAETVRSDTIYGVSVIDFGPAAMAGDVSAVLDGSTRGSITNTGGTVDTITPTTRDGEPALAFTATMPSARGKAKGLTFVTKGRVVEVLVVGPFPIQSEVDRIASSFVSTKAQ